MRVGFIGLGKLGLPVATAMASKGHRVLGYDPHVSAYPDDLSYEQGFTELQGRIEFASLDAVVDECEILFVAVATPHDPRYEGITRVPDERKDFDYDYLRSAVLQIRGAADRLGVKRRVAVISTVLPGTMEREIAPLLGPDHSLVYSPSFIAMGTTIRDFLDPEFVLLGGAPADVARVREVYEGCGIDRFYETSIPNAELVKVAYNTFIGLKLAFANTLGEVCHKTPGTDVDEVTGALKLANRRLISSAYLDAGMGDGGGCHPRDNIALSWLARKLHLSYDLFDAAMMQRERQTEWLRGLIECEAHTRNLPIGILGYAYKPASALTAGSPALLLATLLKEAGYPVTLVDPYVDTTGRLPTTPHVWLVGCKHPDFPDLIFPERSVVIDPWRYMPDQEGVEVIPLGIGPLPHDRAATDGREVRPLAA